MVEPKSATTRKSSPATMRAGSMLAAIGRSKKGLRTMYRPASIKSADGGASSSNAEKTATPRDATRDRHAVYMRLPSTWRTSSRGLPTADGCEKGLPVHGAARSTVASVAEYDERSAFEQTRPRMRSDVAAKATYSSGVRMSGAHSLTTSDEMRSSTEAGRLSTRLARFLGRISSSSSSSSSASVASVRRSASVAMRTVMERTAPPSTLISASTPRSCSIHHRCSMSQRPVTSTTTASSPRLTRAGTSCVVRRSSRDDKKVRGAGGPMRACAGRDLLGGAHSASVSARVTNSIRSSAAAVAHTSALSAEIHDGVSATPYSTCACAIVRICSSRIAGGAPSTRCRRGVSTSSGYMCPLTSLTVSAGRRCFGGT